MKNSGVEWIGEIPEGGFLQRLKFLCKIATGNKDVYLITNGLRMSFSVSSDVNDYGAQMAATVVVAVPLLLLFIFFISFILSISSGWKPQK